MKGTEMPELLLTWMVHSAIALSAAMLCSRLRLPAAVCDAVWRAAVVLPFITSALMLLGVEPSGTAIDIAAPLEVAAQSVPQPAAGPSLHAVGLVVWLAVAAVGVARWVAAHRALSLWLQDAQPAPTAILQLADEIANSAGLRRRLRVLRTPHATSPLAAGGHTVVLPERALTMGVAQLRGVLGHEIAHLSRRDPQWRSAMSLLIALLPFQPLLRLARSAQCRLAEPLCDSLAVEWGADPRQLARSLSDIAHWQHAAQPHLAAAIAAPGSDLIQRVGHLLSGDRSARSGLRRLGVGVSVLLSGVFLVTAPAIQASATPSQDIILGALPREAIQAGVQAGAPAFQGCLEPGQAGTVAVRFTIRADGSVGNPSIKESTMQSAPMEQCLLEQLATLQFPAPEGGGIVMVRYPLRFSAS